MITSKNIIDAVVGGIGFLIFSVFASAYDDNPEYLKITAYLWGVPLFFFYLVYITASHSKAAMIAFTKHGLIGTALTVFVMIVTLYIQNFKIINIVIVNVILLILLLAIYFVAKIYKKV